MYCPTIPSCTGQVRCSNPKVCKRPKDNLDNHLRVRTHFIRVQRVESNQEK